MTSILSQEEISDLDQKIQSLSENAAVASDAEDPNVKTKYSRVLNFFFPF